MDVNEEGDHIQDVVVAFGISLNASTKSEVNAFGFPMNINNGETMSTCAGTSAKPSLFLMPSFSGMQIKCGMGGGSSGGPWLQKFNSNTLSGEKVSVTSFSYALAPVKMHGPHFNEGNIGSLFLENQHN
ncbi:unnamed protein product [Rotaria sp. Silwood2]|nr:unnamed protein product [Rotaria sp. Silwood2]CAF3102631.1 unnamed protein product [Rotaria sp. Silwood2]CAF3437426.1 unnamed protein product [Rotaria sp. Silwood2]CAF4065873.1 unnamed protein product [Rotaria sp. Silwood2]CAF4378084.1 unnamed protein product [Rotaria sp. Silwood2]